MEANEPSAFTVGGGKMRIRESRQEESSDEGDYRTFFEQADVGNVIADGRTLRFVKVNQCFCELTGYRAEQLQELTFFDLADPSEAERHRESWAATLRQKARRFTAEARSVRSDGRTIWVHLAATLVRDDAGELRHVIAVVRDITSRRATMKALEQALLESTERESHRIGQELHDHLCQHLLGAAFSTKALEMRLPADSPLASELNELARLINSAVQQTRDIARSLRPVELDSAGLMAALEELASRPRPGIHCRLECEEPVFIPNPKTALHAYRIAQEAVANAVRHACGSEIVIRLKDDASHIYLEIVDDGRGLSSADARRGMGLEIMKYRAQALAGELRIDTRKSGGTRVGCTLPKHLQ